MGITQKFPSNNLSKKMDAPTWGDVMEIGKYIDFHYKDSTADYDGRLFFENRKLHLELPNIGNTEIVTKSDLLTQLLGNVKITGDDARSSDELYSSLSDGTLYFFHCPGAKGIAAELGFSDINNALCGFIYKASSWRGCGILIPMTGVATDYNMFVGRLGSENHLKWVGVK